MPRLGFVYCLEEERLRMSIFLTIANDLHAQDCKFVPKSENGNEKKPRFAHLKIDPHLFRDNLSAQCRSAALIDAARALQCGAPSDFTPEACNAFERHHALRL